MTEAGVDLVANGKATDFGARGATEAATMAHTRITLPEVALTRLPPIKALPGSRCVRVFEHERFLCVASADRYVISANTAELDVARSLVAAQVAMLLAK